jgi:hypothetical protein
MRRRIAAARDFVGVVVGVVVMAVVSSEYEGKTLCTVDNKQKDAGVTAAGELLWP